MIKCNQGKFQAEGTRHELIFDINQIIESLYKYHPEMMLCVTASWADKLTGIDLNNLDEGLLNHYDEMQEYLLKFLKENREDGI